MRIKIIVGDVQLFAELDNSITAQRIYNTLPVQATFNRWGDEIYFEIPLHLELDENAQDTVEIGDLGYWPPGKAFCIFYGKTPASRNNEIRPASSVNVFGKIFGDATQLKKAAGNVVRVEKA